MQLNVKEVSGERIRVSHLCQNVPCASAPYNIKYSASNKLATWINERGADAIILYLSDHFSAHKLNDNILSLSL